MTMSQTKTKQAQDRMVRAMLCHDLSGPSGMSMGEIASPAPGRDEVRIAIRACGVNFPDLLMTRGEYQFKPEPPFAPGMEVAGIVTEIGEGVSAFRAGDRVIARTQSMYPGFAEAVTLPAKFVLPIPETMPFDEAAALFVTYQTSYHALVEKAHLAAGEVVLVHGGAGGVGLAAVQIALALGARVIATAGSPEKLRYLEGLGVEAAINYGSEDIRARVKALTGDRGVDVVLDPVGGAAFDASLRCLAPEGRLLIVGFTSGEIGTAKANIILIKEVSLIGIRAGEFALRHPDRMRAAFDQLVAWYCEGLIAPQIAARLPLEQADGALMALEERSAIGKIVVTVA